MPGLPITITDAGRAALINAQNTGTNALTINEIALTSSNMEGANFAAMTALPTELKRLTTFSGDVVAADTLHLTIRDESIQSYSMRGFGLILSDGTLFAVYGQAAPIVQKSTASIMLLAVDVVLASLTTAMIEFGNTDFINPPATVDRPGVVELADQPETDAGLRSDVAVVPSRLKVLLTGLLGGKADAAHNHDAGHVTTGVFNVLRIPDLAIAKITGLATALAEKASLAGALFTGAVTISIASGGRLDLRGPAGSSREINFRTDALDRWRIRANGSAESGANNGTLLEFMRFADNGAYLGIPFSIIRATGQVSFETVPRIGLEQIWYAGNFDPNSKAAAIHSHDWAQVTGKPVLLQFVSSLAASGSDLNLCTTPGFYRQPLDAGATDGANYPVGGAGIIEVLAQGNAVEQRYTRPSSGDVFHRGSIGGAWSAWRKFWDSGNFDPASKADAAHTHAGEDITSGTVPLARLPSLPASQTSSGVFDPARIPALAMSAITGLVAALAGKSDSGHVHSGADITTGTVALARLPGLPASQTTSGTFDPARIPALAMSAITGLVAALGGKSDTGHVHSGADITTGTVALARLPSLPASQTTSGTFDPARIPALDASKIGTGAFDPARIPSLDASKVTSGVFDVARIPNLTTSRITDLLDLVWPAGEQHLFDTPTVPAGTRCLVANGAVVSRTTYARLFAAIGTRYGAGDGATTFQIPDWRGLFFRGLDNGRGLDPGRALGTGGYQASQNLQHRHSIASRSSTGSNDNYVEDGDSDGVARSMLTGYEGGSEARPVNEALLACISY
ncbi:MAG: tail fiber protein [Brevundimonas sp.]|uniref:tail fiber protein n=1 Tax=Brevundimonas sp. TaxID=1871086 RepID=UPI002ABA7344|nr:tail fiber protein [Brevundimonas sp.]MDZ4108139.1 tail fiber protein [Brevundimonas sp.]